MDFRCAKGWEGFYIHSFFFHLISSFAMLELVVDLQCVDIECSFLDVVSLLNVRLVPAYSEFPLL